jgi:transcriptional regulator with XRE-family HTH domain
MDADEARTIGRRVRQLRKARRKPLQVVAGLAGMSKSKLDRIERGEVALDRLSDIVALANALQIAPSDLMQLPVPAPANGHTDSAITAVRRALNAVEGEEPGGLMLPVAALYDQVAWIHAQLRACQFTEVATGLPGLIRNLHTTLATGTDHGELLDLAVYLHVHVTRMWLIRAGASTDLKHRTVFLARRLARERDEVTTLAMAGLNVADSLLHSGDFDESQAILDSITLPPTTPETAGLVAYLTVLHAKAAVLEGRPEDGVAPMDAAAELAERFGTTGQPDSRGFLFSPTSAAIDRSWLALEKDEPDQAVNFARQADPRQAPLPVNQTYWWINYGWALSKLRGRQDDAVRALRTAERIFPTAVLRNQGVREVLGEMLTRRSVRGAMGVELRGMAYRAGLPV